MVDPISTHEAARVLKVSPTRVRAMASRGQLPAEKIVDRWVVERSAVEQRRRQKTPSGRRFTPRNAWALLMLVSGEDAPNLDPSVRSRLKRALALEGLGDLVPRLKDRADLFIYNAHPGEISYVLEDGALVRSGISAADSVESGLLPGQEADGYLAESLLQSFVTRHALSPAGPEGNVRVRVVPDDVWSILRGRSVAPQAAVALDLADELDPRSQAAGKALLRELSRSYRARLKGRR